MHGIKRLESRQHLDAGTFDPFFGTGGVSTYSLPAQTDDEITNVVGSPDGSVYTVGGYIFGQSGRTRQLSIRKLTPDGLPDSTFGSEGLARTIFKNLQPTGGKGVVQPDGKLLVAATSQIVIPGGDNDIVDLLLVRYLPDGRIDPTLANGVFRQAGVPTADGARDLKLLPDGKFLVLSGEIFGGRAAVLRFNADGTPDQSFGDGGVSLGPARGQGPAGSQSAQFEEIESADDGSIYGSGYAYGTNNETGNAPFVAKFNSQFEIDSEYGNQGYALFDRVYAAGELELDGHTAYLALQASILGLPGRSVGLARFTAEGEIDRTFGDAGLAVKAISPRGTVARTESLIRQSDGKLLMTAIRAVSDASAAGGFSLQRVLMRFDGSSVEPGFGGAASGVVRTASNDARGSTVTLAQDGSILVAAGSSVERRWRDEAPAAQLFPRTLRQPQSQFYFDVMYRDDDAVDFDTIGNGDLQVIASDGTSRRARFASASTSAPGAVRVRYKLAAPDGVAWNANDNGAFIVRLAANQVADEGGNFAARRTLGELRVRIS